MARYRLTCCQIEDLEIDEIIDVEYDEDAEDQAIDFILSKLDWRVEPVDEEGEEVAWVDSDTWH